MQRSLNGLSRSSYGLKSIVNRGVMEPQAFELLVKMIDQNKAHSDSEFKEIKEKLDEVLAFRYKLLGGSIVISALVGALFHLLVGFTH